MENSHSFYFIAGLDVNQSQRKISTFLTYASHQFLIELKNFGGGGNPTPSFLLPTWALTKAKEKLLKLYFRLATFGKKIRNFFDAEIQVGLDRTLPGSKTSSEFFVKIFMSKVTGRFPSFRWVYVIQTTSAKAPDRLGRRAGSRLGRRADRY